MVFICLFSLNRFPSDVFFSNIKRQVQSKSVMHTIIIAQYTSSNLLEANMTVLFLLIFIFLLFENKNLQISLAGKTNCSHLYVVLYLYWFVLLFTHLNTYIISLQLSSWIWFLKYALQLEADIVILLSVNHKRNIRVRYV